MAWTKESELAPIVDAALGFVGAWNDVAFKYNDLTTAYWKRTWSKETKSASAWTKEA